MKPKRFATPEKNNGKKLTIPARTRSPLEAFKMFEMGQPIDQVAGYYEAEGYLEPDFHMMDKIQKLQALNDYRELMEKNKKAYDEYNTNVINEAKAKAEAQEKAAFEARVNEEVAKRMSLKTQS